MGNLGTANRRLQGAERRVGLFVRSYRDVFWGWWQWRCRNGSH